LTTLTSYHEVHDVTADVLQQKCSCRKPVAELQ